MTNVPPPPCLPPPSGAGCSGRPQATYCDRPITPGKVPLPRFLGGKKENSSTKMPRCCITYCHRNAIGFVKPWQGAWCFCGLEKSDAGMSSPARSPPPSLREWSRVKLTMANFICSSLRFSEFLLSSSLKCILVRPSAVASADANLFLPAAVTVIDVPGIEKTIGRKTLMVIRSPPGAKTLHSSTLKFCGLVII